MDKDFSSTSRKLHTEKRTPDDRHFGVPAPGQVACDGGNRLRALLCRCGTAWSLIRIPTSHVVSEHMECLCGDVLMQWAECADYIFEPIASANSPAN